VSKILIVLSSICLIIYCVVGLYIPELIIPEANKTVDISGYNKLLVEIENADKETLKSLSQMLINDNIADLSDDSSVETINVYHSFDQVLIWLLLLHFSLLLQYFKVQDKHNKSLKQDK